MVILKFTVFVLCYHIFTLLATVSCSPEQAASDDNGNIKLLDEGSNEEATNKGNKTSTMKVLKNDDGTIERLVASNEIYDKVEPRRWPLGLVLYSFDVSKLDFMIAYNLRGIMDVLEGASCVRFKPVIDYNPKNITYINFTNPNGQRECSHEPTYLPSGQIQMVLGLDCLKMHQLLHTVMHAIGCQDEIRHPDRDTYVHVLWENIQPKYKHLFRLERKDQLLEKTEYDPLSIMHFHDRAFTRNGQATIGPQVPGLQIKPSTTLSQLDKVKLRVMFGRECNKRSVGDLVESCKNVFHSKISKKVKETAGDGDNADNNSKNENGEVDNIKKIMIVNNEGSGNDGEKKSNNETEECSGEDSTKKTLIVNNKIDKLRILSLLSPAKSKNKASGRQLKIKKDKDINRTIYLKQEEEFKKGFRFSKNRGRKDSSSDYINH